MQVQAVSRSFVHTMIQKLCSPGRWTLFLGKSTLQILAHISSYWSSSEGNQQPLSPKGVGKATMRQNACPLQWHSLPQRSARAGGCSADGHPVCGSGAFMSDSIFSRWTLHFLLWLSWQSCEAVTQKSPCSFLLRKLSKLAAVKIRDMKVPSAVQSHGANLTGLPQSEHPRSVHCGSWPTG